MNKVVLITGATSGIGQETALFLTQKGYKVYGIGRRPENKSFAYTLLSMDIRDKESIKKVVTHIFNIEGRVDILINNAGVGISGSVEETPIEEIENVFQTNFFGVINLCKEVIPLMRKQSNGLIINISSIAGYMGLPFRGGYCASKGALEILSEAMRMEVQSFGIDICCLAPGDVATDIAQRRYHTSLNEDSPYRESYKKSLSLMNDHVKLGQNPLQISKRIYKIIRTKNPKPRYLQGDFLQEFSIILKKILPQKWYEYLLMRHYQLNKK